MAHHYEKRINRGQRGTRFALRNNDTRKHSTVPKRIIRWELYGPVEQNTLSIDTTDVPDPDIYSFMDGKLFDFAQANGLIISKINHAGRTVHFEEKAFEDEF